MLTDSRLDTYIEQKIAPQTAMRHFAKGSIDYHIYDRRGRGFIDASSVVAGLFRRVFVWPGHTVQKLAGPIQKTTDQAEIVPAE